MGFVWGIQPVTGEFPAQKPVTRKMFPFDEAITTFEQDFKLSVKRVFLKTLKRSSF